MSTRYPWFVRRDLDGFFGLFVDNLVQLLVISELCVFVAGLPREFVYSVVLPGAALSVLVGNLYYSWQARKLAQAQGREDMTALPYGINTPSVFAYIFFIMGPIYMGHRATLGDAAAAKLAWQAGLVACLGSGLIEFFGAFVAERIRRVTPRAALLGALAGIAIGFISMDFTLQVFERPLLALVPAGIILIQYFSGVRLPLGLPAGLTALIVGTTLGWGLKLLAMHPAFASVYGALSPAVQREIGLEIAKMPTVEAVKGSFVFAMHLPRLQLAELFGALNQKEILGMLGIIVPMGLFNVIGSLQNIESAEAEGDKFPTASSLAVNGIGSIMAACFGSCFPTTIYIGHAGWKRLGARTGYSGLNGIVIALLCFTGLIRTVGVIIPLESIIGILIWIAVIIGAQAFQAVPRRHAPAVVLGLFPALAAWGFNVLKSGVRTAGTMMPDAGAGPLMLQSIGLDKMETSIHVGGLIGLYCGFIITSMGWAALGVHLIDREFKKAAGWAMAMAVLSFFGVIHAWDPANLNAEFNLGLGTGWRYAIPYMLMALIIMGLANRAKELPPRVDDDNGGALH